MSESSSRHAFEKFTPDDFDGVVICGSVPGGMQRALAQRIYEYSPSTVIAQMIEFENRDLAGVLWLASFSREKINRQILTSSARDMPSGTASPKL